MSTVKPFAGGWFVVHNWLFDEAMRRLSPNGWKILSVCVRQTLGWRDPGADDNTVRREWDILSYSQFREKAGIASDSTVRRALQECIKAGYIVRRPAGTMPGTGATTYAYSLNRDYTATVSEEDTRTATKSVADTATESVAATATDSVETKEHENTSKDSMYDDDGHHVHDAMIEQGSQEAEAVAALLERGWNSGEPAGRRFVAKHGVQQVLAICAHAQAHGLGAGWVRTNAATWTLSAPPPRRRNGNGNGHQGRRRTDSILCPECWQHPCACEEVRHDKRHATPVPA